MGLGLTEFLLEERIKKIAPSGGSGQPTGDAGGVLAGQFPNPGLAPGVATGSVLGPDVLTTSTPFTGTITGLWNALSIADASVTAAKLADGVATGTKLGTDVARISPGTGKLFPLTQIQQVLASTDLTDISGTYVAGSGFRSNGAVFKPNGLRFSAVAYGVVGDNNNATATANGTALDACIAAAKAAGEGSIVELDWTGTAYLPGGHKVWTRLWYKGTKWNKSKLANGAAAGTNLYETGHFQTETQTIPADYTHGDWEYWFTDHWLDGNLANNASGGCGLAGVGYGFRLDNLHIESCAGPGWWNEWSLTNEPINSGVGSLHQRGFSIGTLFFSNNGGNAVPARNTRLSQSRGAVTAGQVALFGPGDSKGGYIEIFKGGTTVAGNGMVHGSLDFNAGSFNAFHLTLDGLTIWGNHDIALVAAGSFLQATYAHIEGGWVNVLLTGSGLRLDTGKIFGARGSFTRSSTTTSGSSSVSVTVLNAGTNISQGMFISGSGIPAGTFITGVDPVGNTVTLSANATASATVTLTYGATSIAVPGSSSGNFSKIDVHEPSNQNGGTQCKIACVGGALTEGRIRIIGEIGAAGTITLAAGSMPTNANELDIIYTDYSGGAATVTPGWVPGPTGVGANTNYRLYRSLQPLSGIWRSRTTDPGTSDISSGLWGVWKNTTSGAVKLWVNDGGTMKSVALA